MVSSHIVRHLACFTANGVVRSPQAPPAVRWRPCDYVATGFESIFRDFEDKIELCCFNDGLSQFVRVKDGPSQLLCFNYGLSKHLCVNYGLSPHLCFNDGLSQHLVWYVNNSLSQLCCLNVSLSQFQCLNRC